MARRYRTWHLSWFPLRKGMKAKKKITWKRIHKALARSFNGF